MPQIQPTTRTESLSLPEMLRIMDVATEIRRQRETVEKEFAFDDTKRMLREKLLNATSVTGERVTEAEVDTAIDSYFSTLYTFREPAASTAVTLARLYVRRLELAFSAILLLAIAGGAWWVLHMTSVNFSRTVRNARQAVPLATSINSLAERIRSIAREKEVTDELERWRSEADVARRQFDLNAMKAISARMTNLLNQLNTIYEIRINSDPNQQSGFTRSFEEEGKAPKPAYYVIVSAKDDQGQVLRRKIRNSETNQTSEVEQWAEQIPKAVYDRIAADKKSDGILNETLFAKKERGYREERVKLQGASESPLERIGQITSW